MDLMVTRDYDGALKSMTVRGEYAKEHAKLLADIESKFCSYGRLLENLLVSGTCRLTRLSL
jgi:hypothetical protein